MKLHTPGLRLCRAILMSMLGALGALSVLGLTGNAAAQANAAVNFPTKPIRFISPSGPGLVNDAWTRLLAQKLSERTGWTTVVENRAGGNYVIGTQALMSAPADGHTVLAAVSSMPVVQYTMKPAPFDMRRDMTPLTRVTNVQLVLVANINQPFKTLPEMVSYARAHPAKLSYGSLNLGSLTHLAGELLKDVAGIDMVNVPYNGETLMIDTMSGLIHVAVMTTSSVRANVAAGKLRALAILGPKRSPILPGVPTVEETGLPAIDADGWQGLVIRSGTPPAVVERLQREINAVIAAPDFQEKLVALGALPISETSDQFRRKIEADLDTWGKLINSGKVKF